MSDRMNGIPFAQLIRWVLTEYEIEQSVFGVPKDKFYRKEDHNTLSLFDRELESPLGPAAGPNTQLAQNIIAAYLTGSRVFELKTVQIIDGEDLPVAKPCILAKDEGYNVEWSTELTVSEAYEEYIKAWFALNIISKEFSLGSSRGFLFNMSVGYDLAGIQSPKVNTFIDQLMDASETVIWKECKGFLLENTQLFHNIKEEYIATISANVCNSIALSTLHGCKPAEIERIATYLLSEKKLHTYVKCNPTLLGYEFARNTLDRMGYDYLVFDDHHFKEDLQFEEAVPMLRRLGLLAKKQGLTFGVKLSNTFPVKISSHELPGEEMYLSGRALYPLTINLADRLAKELEGCINISYSGGADYFNIDKIYETGIWPITLATTVLKPGGYLRFRQLTDVLCKNSQKAEATGYVQSRTEFCSRKNCSNKRNGGELSEVDLSGIEHIGTVHIEARPIGTDPSSTDQNRTDLNSTEFNSTDLKRIDLKKLQLLAMDAMTDENYQKQSHEIWNKKRRNKVPLTDCFMAPCKVACPIGQDIPEYIRLMGEGRNLEAFEVILAKNPLPFITGTLCNHRCMTGCTRHYYEEPVCIREAKLLAAQNAYKEYISTVQTPELKSGLKVAIIGGGPAGLSGAYYLRKSGIEVTVFDCKEEIGGVIRHLAPSFRISEEAIQYDLELIRSMGVKFRLGVALDFSIEALKKEGFQYILLAIGAWKPGVLPLQICDRPVLNVLDFLERYNKDTDSLQLGRQVAVIGAGNSAMDGARAAVRVKGVEKVTIIYRRTMKYMPAEKEEITLALSEGVEIKELLSPVSYVDGILRCQRMELGAPDESGRRSPIPIPGDYTELPIDSVIAAVGEQVETELFVKNLLEIDDKGRLVVDPHTNETSVERVFAGGDCLRGPATIVEGIADGTKFAATVLERELGKQLKQEITAIFNEERRQKEIEERKGVMAKAGLIIEEKSRCLECQRVCNLCVEVCPNRANIAVKVTGTQFQCSNQILHIDGMCNECGNCEAFCPYDSAPYLEKPTLYWSKKAFEESSNTGFVIPDPSSKRILIRYDGKVKEVSYDSLGNSSGDIPENLAAVINTVLEQYSYVLI